MLLVSFIMLQESKISLNNVNVLEGWARGMDFEIETQLVAMWKRGYFDMIITVKSPRCLILLVKFPKLRDPCLLF